MIQGTDTKHRDQASDVHALVVGSVLAQLRRMQGLGQMELATKVGITQTTLSRMERGTSPPSPDELRRLAAVFGLRSALLTVVIAAAFARMDRAAQLLVGPQGLNPWPLAFSIVGRSGLAGLATFAVAAQLSLDGIASASAEDGALSAQMDQNGSVKVPPASSSLFARWGS